MSANANRRHGAAIVAALALLLAGCGGGDSPQSTNPPPAAPAATVTFSPSSGSATTTDGVAATMRLVLTLSEQAAGEVDHILYEDVDSHIDRIVMVDRTARVYTTDVIFSPTLPGTYSGTIRFELCKDLSCTSSVAGSPFTFSYSLAVQTLPPPEVTPAAISLSMETDDSRTLDLTVTPPGNETFHVGASDPQGRFENPVQIVSNTGGSQVIRVKTARQAVAGTYTGNLVVFLCRTADCSQASQVQGSSVAVPYTLQVTPENLLQPVPTVSGLPEWETFQGTNSHTGYVPFTVDVSRISQRWSWTPPAGVGELSPVTAGSGKVVVTTSGYFQEASVFALKEADGTIAWRHDFGSIFAANHPGVWGGRVFVATSGHEDTAMWSFDLTNGGVLFRTSFASQWEHYLAPTVAQGYVYTDGGAYGGMYSFKARTGALRWFAGLSQYDLWTPAVDDNYAYSYTGSEFAILNRLSGQRHATIANSSFNWRGYALNITPVLPGDGSALVVDGIYSSPGANHLIRYNIAAATEAWRANGTFVTNPVVAKGVVYILNASSNRLEARDLTSGAINWTWVLPNAQESLPVGNLVVTENLIFLSSNSTTYAIDLATHVPAWSVARTGDLALSSNRILYISGANRLDAIDLASP